MHVPPVHPPPSSLMPAGRVVGGRSTRWVGWPGLSPSGSFPGCVALVISPHSLSLGVLLNNREDSAHLRGLLWTQRAECQASFSCRWTSATATAPALRMQKLRPRRLRPGVCSRAPDSLRTHETESAWSLGQPFPASGPQAPHHCSKGLVGLVSKSTGSRAPGCLSLCPWPWHSAGPAWVPRGYSVDTGQGNGCAWGSLGVSAHQQQIQD